MVPTELKTTRSRPKETLMLPVAVSHLVPYNGTVGNQGQSITPENSVQYTWKRNCVHTYVNEWSLSVFNPLTIRSDLTLNSRDRTW